jgi:4-hydroxy-tetrahydrodipicolinate synthase
MLHSKKGYIPVMLTPFKDNGAIDYESLTQLTEFYLEAGVTGLFANCLSSEMYELNEYEKLKVIKHVVKLVNGLVPVVACGSFGATISKKEACIKQVNDTGVNAVILITSVIATQREPDVVLTQRILQLIELTGAIKLGLYECPVPYKRILTATQLGQLVATGRITYLKDTSLDIQQVRAKLAAVKDDAFGLYDAYMVHAVESLKAGAAGLSCIQGNFFPELIVWLCTHYNDAARSEEVDTVQQFLTDRMDLMHDVYPIIAKYYLQKRGLSISTFTRRKVGSFTNEVKSRIDKLYNDYAYLQKELEITTSGFPV